MPKTVGIIGGMGPESTIRLMQLIFRQTPAEKEQDHLRMIVDNRPQIPDRTEFILGNGPSPVPMLVDSAKMLAASGADILAIACNTAHCFIEEIRHQVNILVLDMLEIAANEIRKQFPVDSSLVLLATSGSLKIGLFGKYLTDYHLLVPEANAQEKLVMEAVYGKDGIKNRGVSEESSRQIIAAIQPLLLKKPLGIVAGCTEVELALETVSIPVPVIYPVKLLARQVVQLALAK